MKIVTTKEKLEPVLSQAERVTSKTATLPVLGCLLLAASKGTLMVRATNLDLGVEFSVPVKMEKDGTVAIPGTALRALVSGARGTIITLETKDDTLLVTTENHTAVLKTVSHDDFPVIPKLPRENSITLPSEQLVRALRAVSYSAAVSTIKPELSSVYVYTQKGTLVAVATDAFRLAEKKCSIEGIPENVSFLLPVKNVHDSIRIFEENAGLVTLCFGEHQMGVYHENYYLTARIVEGVFPDYKQIIPKEVKAEAVCLKHDVMAALKTTGAFLNTLNQVRLEIAPTKREFVVTAQNNTIGECHERIPAALKGEETAVTVNHRYFFDCFQSIATDSVSLTFGEPMKPVVIRGVSDNSFLYLLMPMST